MLLSDMRCLLCFFGLMLFCMKLMLIGVFGFDSYVRFCVEFLDD